MERFAAIDFETANGKRSSICSIGIAILEDDWVVDSIYTLVRPTPNFYTRWTTAIHGLSAEDTNDALCFEEAWESIAPKLKDLPLVAHNSPFDEGCLKAAHEVYDLAYPKYPFYCTCRLSRKMYPFLVNHQLQTVAAIRYVTNGSYAATLRDYETIPCSEEMQPLMDRLKEMTNKFEAVTNATKEAANQELLDFVARRLYEMAAVCVMSHLLIQDATKAPELFAKSAVVYLNYAEAEVEKHFNFIRKFKAEELDNYRK